MSANQQAATQPSYSTASLASALAWLIQVVLQPQTDGPGSERRGPSPASNQAATLMGASR